MAAYLAEYAPASPHRSLADLIAFNEANRAREMRYFGQELFLRGTGQGRARQQRVRRCARDLPQVLARRGHRPGAGRASARCAGGAHGRAGVAHRLHSRRQPGRRFQLAGRRRRLSAHHGARRAGPRPAVRDLVRRHRVVGAGALRHRLRVRTGDAPPAAAHLSANRRPVVTVRGQGAGSRPATRGVQRLRRAIAPVRDTDGVFLVAASVSSGVSSTTVLVDASPDWLTASAMAAAVTLSGRSTMT